MRWLAFFFGTYLSPWNVIIPKILFKCAENLQRKLIFVDYWFIGKGVERTFRFLCLNLWFNQDYELIQIRIIH